MIDLPISNENLRTIFDIITKIKFHFEFRFIIEKEQDVKAAKKIISEYKVENYSLFPSYNGNNLDFFKKHVFLTEYDIKNNEKLTEKDLFIRSIINMNYFGKLILMCNGDLCSNMHLPALCKIDNDKLHEFVYKELTEGSWVLTRNKILPCKDCVYNLFCPPVSNYEYAIGRNNLCHFLDQKRNETLTE